MRHENFGLDRSGSGSRALIAPCTSLWRNERCAGDRPQHFRVGTETKEWQKVRATHLERDRYGGFEIYRFFWGYEDVAKTVSNTRPPSTEPVSEKMCTTGPPFLESVCQHLLCWPASANIDSRSIAVSRLCPRVNRLVKCFFQICYLLIFLIHIPHAYQDHHCPKLVQ